MVPGTDGHPLRVAGLDGRRLFLSDLYAHIAEGQPPGAVRGFSFIIAILLIYTHRKNIERLKAGTESKIYIWKPRHVKVDPEEAKDKGANK